jgi:TonB-dependent SusC/RagA subfamily outer membrane receptor
MHRRLVVAAGSIAASLTIAGSLGAQTGVISGVIFDETNRVGLQGAQVAIKGTELIGVSGKDGKFTISGVPAGSHQIEAWRVGYRSFKLSPMRIAANDTTHLYLALASNADDPATPASSPTAYPVRTRSSTEPLIIIDGVIQQPGAGVVRPSGANIPPQNIESVEVVKGAAAVQLYGERARDGVIVITTRK